jgi:pimeloyl-ACP methyl ester carboxylesterase
MVPGTVWHSELIFELPPHRRFAERLGRLGKVVSFDKRGTGLSDRYLGGGSLDDRVADISAVMDDAGIEHATIMGLSEGGSMGALFAASVPSRVDGLVLGMGLMYGPSALTIRGRTGLAAMARRCCRRFCPRGAPAQLSQCGWTVPASPPMWKS